MREIAILIGAFVFWGFMHSVTATFRVKDFVSRTLGAWTERYYRLTYVALATITFLPILALPVLLPDVTLWTIPMPWALLTGAVQLAAVAALGFSLLQSGSMAFLGIPQALGASAPDKSEQLNTGGLYRYMRHPLYTFSMLFLWLTPVMTRNVLVLYAAFSIYFLVGAIFEEAKLVKQFPGAYEAYRARTKMFVPWVF